MTTVATSAPPRVASATPVVQPSLSAMPLSSGPSEAKGLWTDWAALVIWASCFGLMALIHLKDLLVSLLR